MAGSQSFGKRENEKKKQAKRLEKQKRKEERQATGTSSFDDMIAYVDENGNFTDVPPEERKKEAVKLEDIVIAVPKKTTPNRRYREAGSSISTKGRDTALSRISRPARSISSMFRLRPRASRKATPLLSRRSGAHGA